MPKPALPRIHGLRVRRSGNRVIVTWIPSPVAARHVVGAEEPGGIHLAVTLGEGSHTATFPGISRQNALTVTVASEQALRLKRGRETALSVKAAVKTPVARHRIKRVRI